MPKTKSNFHITNLAKREARFSLLVPIAADSYVVNKAPAEVANLEALARNPASTLAEPGGAASSLAPLAQSAPGFETFDDVKPKDGDYIFPLFRALSQVVIPGHWIDFTKKGVLEASVPLLAGQTVFKNHYFYDVEKWLGAVNKSVWDAKGENTGGVPGINAELKIDWKVNPLVARGLLMTPPAIHSVSVTVVSEFEYSHPDIAAESRWKFYDLLGEEVNGEIVRFIVTKILGYLEISLVFQGADGLANVDDVQDAARESFSPRGSGVTLQPPPTPTPAPAAQTDSALPPVATQPTPKEKTTVKLSDQRKKALGLEAHQGEEVDDAIVLGAVDGLAARAEAATVLLAARRAEGLRVATLAEAGADGHLPAALAEVIQNAPAAQLEALISMYETKAAARFTSRCQSCGSTEIDSRSSVETPPNEGATELETSYAGASANSLHD